MPAKILASLFNGCEHVTEAVSFWSLTAIAQTGIECEWLVFPQVLPHFVL
jgi:hypothetical protein